MMTISFFLYLYSGYLLTVLKRLHYQKHPSVTYFVRHYVAKVVPTANNIKVNNPPISVYRIHSHTINAE